MHRGDDLAWLFDIIITLSALEMFTKRRLEWAKPLDLPQFENMPS